VTTSRKRIIIYSGLTVLLLTVLLWPAVIQAGAGPTLRSLLGWEVAPEIETQLPAAAELPTPSHEEIMALPDAPQFVSAALEQLTQTEQAILRLEELTARAEQKYIKSGWWHILTETQGFITASDNFPNGEPIPKQWTSEIWMQIDEEGFQVKRVSFQDTGDPLTSNAGIYQNGVATNLTLNESWPEEKTPVRFTGFLDDIKREKEHVEVRVTETTYEGVEVVVLSVTTQYERPIDFNPEKTLEEELKAGVIGRVSGEIRTYTISVEDGLVLVFELSFIYPDGNVKLASRTVTIDYSSIQDLPIDVVAYLEGEQK